ncbi:MAG TPA: hypothetical protein VLB44_09335, partial [Kofleriaceae bacterium]|nr:hypothetical protein [Kofleriaceae bacterium]
ANNVRFIEREHLYALGSTMDAVKKIIPDAAECSKTAADAIAVILGSAPSRPSKPPKPAKPRARTEKSVIFRLKDEFKDMVHELTGVFKLEDIEQPRARQKQKTQAVQTLGRVDRRTGPALIAGDRSARKPQQTKLFAHHDDSHPFTPVSTTVEVMSLPAMLKARQAAEEATQVGFEAEEATFARPRSDFAFGDITEGGERTVIDSPALHKPLGKKDLSKTRPVGAIDNRTKPMGALVDDRTRPMDALVDNRTKPMGSIDSSRPKTPSRPPPPPTRGRS